MNETRAAGAFEAKRICAQCGLVIVSARAACPRCGASLADAPPGAVDRASAVEPVPDGGVRRRLMWIAAVVVLSIFGWSRSLLLTSEPIDADQRDAVMRAIAVLEHAGFSPEVVMLRHFANYRATDNWWNVYLGHQDAYAATNFPLGSDCAPQP